MKYKWLGSWVGLGSSWGRYSPVGKDLYMGMVTGLMVEKRWSNTGSRREAVVSTP